MDSILKKFKLLYIPFLILAVSFITIYTFLNWLIVIKLQLFSINEEIINFWLPMGLSWVPILIWLRPGIKLLNLKTRRGDLPGLYFFIAWLAVSAPTIIAQMYIQTASGILTKLDTINEIVNLDATKYYTIKNFYIDKQNIGIYKAFNVSGKLNADLDMYIYIVLPILINESYISKSDCMAWYGIKYHKRISNSLDPIEKDSLFKEFAVKSEIDFKFKNVYRFNYLDRIGNTEDHEGYNSAIKNNRKYSANSTIVLIPADEPFAARGENKFAWIFGAFGIGAFVWLVMVMIPGFDQSELKKFNTKPKLNKTALMEGFSLFIPDKDFFITPLIVDLNIIIFVIMVISGLGFFSFKADDLLKWGAGYKPAIINGEWWRLFTCMFLHGGFIHLFANMYGLFFVSIFLEPLLGKARFALFYLLAGLLASLASLWWNDPAVSVGASGAIFGLYGIFLALLVTKIFPKEFNKAFLTSTLIFIGYNLLIGISGGIDNAAHVGGLVSGFALGLVIYPHLKATREDEELAEQAETQPIDQINQEE